MFRRRLLRVLKCVKSHAQLPRTSVTRGAWRALAISITLLAHGLQYAIEGGSGVAMALSGGAASHTGHSRSLLTQETAAYFSHLEHRRSLLTIIRSLERLLTARTGHSRGRADFT